MVFCVEQDGTALSLWLDRSVTPAWGQAGGLDAVGPVAVGDLGTPDEARHTKATDLRLATGQGAGPPSRRDPALAARDVADGYVSERRAAAREGRAAAALEGPNCWVLRDRDGCVGECAGHRDDAGGKAGRSSRLLVRPRKDSACRGLTCPLALCAGVLALHRRLRVLTSVVLPASGADVWDER